MSWSYSQRSQCFVWSRNPLHDSCLNAKLWSPKFAMAVLFLVEYTTRKFSTDCDTSQHCLQCEQQTLQWHGEQTLSVHPKISQTVPRKVWWSLLGRVALGLKISQGISQNYVFFIDFGWPSWPSLFLIDVQEFLWFWWAFSDFLSGWSSSLPAIWCENRGATGLIHGRLVVQEAPKNKNKLEK